MVSTCRACKQYHDYVPVCFRASRQRKAEGQTGAAASLMQGAKRCWYCGRSEQLTRDHVIPKAQGGQGGKNIMPACFECNQRKGNRDLIRYRWALQSTPNEPFVFFGEMFPEKVWPNNDNRV